jgi:hypothetical protein
MSDSDQQSYLLSEQEKDRFIWWLVNEAARSRGMAAKAEQLGITHVRKELNPHAAATEYLAKYLRSFESMTISKG